MEWLKNLNSAIAYIEEHLDGEISYKEAARRACCSVCYFQRLFSYIAGVSLSEYIRRRRLDIALGMISMPALLFLDEPTAFMDVESRMAMWDMVKKIRDEFGTTIFLTTHDLEEADSLSDNICIMKDGRAVMQGTPSALRAMAGQETLEEIFLRLTREEKETDS